MDELFSDDRLLIEAFMKRGITASSVVWQDRDIHWDDFDLALIRSTWDYIDDREGFLSVLKEIEISRCRLYNPLEAVRWNSDKQYLLDLASWDVSTVPTYRVSLMDRDSWQEMVIKEEWQTVVVKPLIGAGGSGVRRIALEELPDVLEQLATELPDQEFLVQPLIESVITEGEWSYIYLGGELSHVLLKKPASGDYRAHGIYGGTIEVLEPRSEDVLQVETIIAALPFDLLYARLDLVRIGSQLSLMELELIEPMLYFSMVPASVDRLVDASLTRLAK